jgi:hypothetical protein
MIVYEVRFNWPWRAGKRGGTDTCWHKDLDEARACARARASQRDKHQTYIGSIQIVKTEVVEEL